ncbi:MAG: GGDEF domain-containing protein [Pseudobutyrivibrio sp.]|nr:GGDEF domain-containing protein [Pseudobutyrivibrio sp.]
MRTKRENWLKRAEKFNTAVGIIAMLIVLICYLFTRNEYKTFSDLTNEIQPITVAHLEDGSVEYFFNVSDCRDTCNGMVFFTSHQLVKGYAGGKEIFDFTHVEKPWGSTPGSNFHFVEINDRMANLAIVVKPVYEVVRGQQLSFFVGNSNEMYNSIMEESMPRFFVSLLIVIFSMVLFAYYIIMRDRVHLSKELLYLSYLSFFAGIWSLNETDVTSLLIRNKVFDSIIPYFCLMLVVPPFVRFFDSYLDLKSKIVKDIVSTYAITQFIVLTILHFTGILEFRESLAMMQLLIFISSLYMFLGVIGKIITGKINRHVKICAFGLTAFFAAVVIDISQYYKGLGDSDHAGRYVFLAFVFLLAWDMIKDAYDIIEKGRRAKQLEVFALTDSMTGLFNRNAFESHADTENRLEGLVAVVADANGLKKCNDTYGHDAGDIYITKVADTFNHVFGKYGNCYRIGGDEFCCIIPSGKHVNMERLKKQFYTEIYTINLSGDYAFNIGVAVGDACYDKAVDRDFRSLVKRADVSMYANKKATKAQVS